MKMPQSGRGRLAVPLVLAFLLGLCVPGVFESSAEPDPQELQEPLPPGVARLSLARLHARTLALHHNELQVRGRGTLFIYPPDVYASGINLRAWTGKSPDIDALAEMAVELTRFGDAVRREAALAAGVEFGADDLRVELHAPGVDQPWVLRDGRLIAKGQE
jgi:hypothetical protein